MKEGEMLANPTVPSDTPKPAPCEQLEEPSEKETTLLDAFNNIEDLSSPGEIYAGGIAKELPVAPGLHVKGVGIIPLPLTRETAKKLRQVSPPKMVEGKTVRNALEINADRITLDNPSWNKGMNQLVQRVCLSLDVAAKFVTPKLSQMLLFENGGFFERHRNAEKEDTVFATLVVQLPSSFQGGSFVAYHEGREKKISLDSPNTAPHHCHFVAHYADCQHEFLPVETGYQLALVYSLFYTGKNKPTVEDIYDGDFVSVLSDLPLRDSLFAVPLFYRDGYKRSSITRYGSGCLKGSDRALARSISQAEGWEVVIAKLEREDEEFGHMDYDGDFDVECIDDSITSFKDMFGENGECADSYHDWLDDELVLKSIKNGGMILATEDECEEMWEKTESTELESTGFGTGGAGWERVTTYSTYVLIAFSVHRNDGKEQPHQQPPSKRLRKDTEVLVIE